VKAPQSRKSTSARDLRAPPKEGRKDSRRQDVVSNSTVEGGGARRMTDASECASESGSVNDWESPQPRRSKMPPIKDTSPPADPEELETLREEVTQLLARLGKVPKRNVGRNLHQDAESLRGVFKTTVSFYKYKRFEELLDDVDDRVRELENDITEKQDRRAEFMARQAAETQQEDHFDPSQLSDEFDEFARPKPAEERAHPSQRYNFRKQQRGFGQDRSKAKHQQRMCDADCAIM